MGIELTDMFITLKPRQQWKRARTQAELTTLIDRHLRELPGQRLAFSQPIEMRINEMVSGSRADLAVKLYGDDLDVLVAKGKHIEAIINRIRGSADVSLEQVTGQPLLEIKLDQDQLARYGVPAKVVMDVIESIGSKPLGEVIEGQLRFPLVARLPESFRGGREAIASILIPTAVSGGLQSRPTSEAGISAASWPMCKSACAMNSSCPPAATSTSLAGSSNTSSVHRGG
jgi:cobalt-zinc-cadmium resistance protein CzcA